MFKQTITYTDFNGTERTEDFYFHLSLPEITRLEAEIGKPLDKYTAELAHNNDANAMVNFVEKIILGSYGEKTEDGRSFHKSKELTKKFEYSQAYAELFEQMLVNKDLAKKFGEGIVDNGKKRKNQVDPKVVKE